MEPFAVASATGPITPGAITSVMVKLAIPFEQPGFVAAQALTLTLTGESSARSINVSAVGRGAVVSFTSASFDFDLQATATVKNTGNDVANITYRAVGSHASSFTVDPPSFSLAPSGTRDVVLRVAPAAGFGASADIDFVQSPGVPGTVCASAPAKLTYVDGSGSSSSGGGN